MTQAMNNLIQEAKTVADDALAVFGKLSSAQLNWKPATDRWSVAQCFDHLVSANRGYFPIVESIIKGEKKSTLWERVPLFPTIWGKLLIKSLDPSSTRKLKAPKRFEPKQSEVSGSIIEDFVRQQSAVIELMKATEHLDLDKIVITSPAASAITYSLMDSYRIIVVHEQRHFQQAKRVVEEAGFPGG